MKRDLKNKEVFAIGDKVLKAVRLADDEIDRIVSSPALFDSIRKAVQTAQPYVADVPSSYLPIFQRPLAVFAVAGLIIAVSLGVAGLLIRNGVDTVEPAELNESITQEPIPESLIVTGDVGAFYRETVGANADRAPRRKTRATEPRRHKAVIEEQLGEFQAVTYAGDEPDGEGRIVRVELPRASLYAMGIDVPVENAAASIKADLLIGFDGVMKAVRVVKMD
jgi:hypothetical protein